MLRRGVEVVCNGMDKTGVQRFFEKRIPQMPPSDTAIRAAKPAEKACKLPDEKGLFLLIDPNGSKYWQQKYRFSGKEKTLAHGVYPAVGLKDGGEHGQAISRTDSCTTGIRMAHHPHRHPFGYSGNFSGNTWPRRRRSSVSSRSGHHRKIDLGKRPREC